MEIRSANDTLAKFGLKHPTLNALIPDETNYTVLLMQPRGEIEANATGVWNRNRDLAVKQFGQFIGIARQNNVDLAITPEYSMHWKALVDSIANKVSPEPGKLWVFGCESIKYSQLSALKEALSSHVLFLYEDLLGDDTKFVDPLVYLFRTARLEENNPDILVGLIQFKTHPMGDADHFEINGLQRGNIIYRFGDPSHTISLLSLICSDVFAFTDALASEIYNRSLILHIQLNAKPRHTQYRYYRDCLLKFAGDQTELICLNWAHNVKEWSGALEKPWGNIAGSAWYLRPDKYDLRDSTLSANHRLGLYYTWLEPLRYHALFFNYLPAIFHLIATKVVHLGVPAAISRRVGPKLTQTAIWNETLQSWTHATSADDGFNTVVHESGNAATNLIQIASQTPLSVERLIALCAGDLRNCDTWHELSQLHSCNIDSSEVIRRYTFCQDPDQAACDFRIGRLKRCGHLWDIAAHSENLPPALDDFKQGFRFEWNEASPHQNAISSTGKYATLIYMGEESSNRRIEETAMRTAERLHRAFTTLDQALTAKQRLAVWYRDNTGKIVQFSPHRYAQVTNENISEFDITRGI